MRKRRPLGRRRRVVRRTGIQGGEKRLVNQRQESLFEGGPSGTDAKAACRFREYGSHSRRGLTGIRKVVKERKKSHKAIEDVGLNQDLNVHASFLKNVRKRENPKGGRG